jgi:hypothetical protein
MADHFDGDVLRPMWKQAVRDGNLSHALGGIEGNGSIVDAFLLALATVMRHGEAPRPDDTIVVTVFRTRRDLLPTGFRALGRLLTERYDALAVMSMGGPAPYEAWKEASGDGDNANEHPSPS